MLLVINSLLLFLISWFSGSFFVWRLTDQSKLKSALIASVLGLGLLSYVIFFLGLFTTKFPFWLVLCVLWIIFSIIFVRRFQSLVKLFSQIRFPRNYLDNLLTGAIFLLMIGHAIIASSPIIRWDAATHHYLVPKIWLDAGKITSAPQTVFSEYPSIIETLYMIGLQSFSEIGANIIGFFLSVILLLAVYEFTKERFDTRTALVSVLIFFSMPLVIEIVTGGMIDIGYTLFIFMSFWMYIEHREKSNRHYLILSSVFAGFALSSKHLAIQFIVAFIISIFIHDIIRRKFAFRKYLKDMVLFVLIAFLIASPWYIKSYLNTGNPIHPFLPALFNHAEEIKAPISVHAWSRPDFKRGIISFITYPWLITTDFTFLDFWIMGISPLFLATIPFWWFYRKKSKGEFFPMMIIFSIIFVFIAYRIAPSSTRYMLPLFTVLSVLSSSTLVFLARDLRKFRTAVLIIVLTIPFLFNLAVETKRIRDIHPWLVKKENKEELYDRQFEGYDSIRFINQSLPDDVVVLSTDPRGYFFKKKFYIGSPGAESHLLPSWSDSDPQKIFNEWHKLGITHLLFNLSRNVMKNSYFVYTVTKGIQERGELLMTSDELAELTKYETEYTYKPEEIAEFGRITETPTIIKDGKTYYHLTHDWWSRTVKQDKSQYMLRQYLFMKPFLKEIAHFKGAILYEIDYQQSQVFESGKDINK